MKLRVVLFALLLLFAGCIGEQREPPARPPRQSVMPPVLNVSNVTNASNATLPAGCISLTLLSERDACFFAEATAGNWSACGEITGRNTADDCVRAKAIALNDSGICSGILSGEKRNACGIHFKLLACDGLASEGARSLCRALALENASVCGGDADCLFDYAINRSDSMACALLSGAVDAKACEAAVASNHSLCSGLAFVESADLCIEKFALKLGRWDACGAIKTEVYRQECFTKIALQTGDHNFCEYINTDIGKDECCFQVAQKTLDPAPCPSIIEPVKRDQCFINTAKQSGRPVFCAGIESSHRRNYYCYATLIESGDYRLSFSWCGEIIDRDAVWRDKCFYRLVKQGGDHSACERIEDENLRRACYS